MHDPTKTGIQTQKIRVLEKEVPVLETTLLEVVLEKFGIDTVASTIVEEIGAHIVRSDPRQIDGGQ